MFQIGDIITSAENNLTRKTSPYRLTGGESFKGEVVDTRIDGNGINVIQVKVLQIDDKFTEGSVYVQIGDVHPLDAKYFKLFDESENVIKLK